MSNTTSPTVASPGSVGGPFFGASSPTGKSPTADRGNAETTSGPTAAHPTAASTARGDAVPHPTAEMVTACLAGMASVRDEMRMVCRQLEEEMAGLHRRVLTMRSDIEAVESRMGRMERAFASYTVQANYNNTQQQQPHDPAGTAASLADLLRGLPSSSANGTFPDLASRQYQPSQIHDYLSLFRDSPPFPGLYATPPTLPPSTHSQPEGFQPPEIRSMTASSAPSVVDPKETASVAGERDSVVSTSTSAIRTRSTSTSSKKPIEPARPAGKPSKGLVTTGVELAKFGVGLILPSAITSWVMTPTTPTTADEDDEPEPESRRSSVSGWLWFAGRGSVSPSSRRWNSSNARLVELDTDDDEPSAALSPRPSQSRSARSSAVRYDDPTGRSRRAFRTLPDAVVVWICLAAATASDGRVGSAARNRLLVDADPPEPPGKALLRLRGVSKAWRRAAGAAAASMALVKAWSGGGGAATPAASTFLHHLTSAFPILVGAVTPRLDPVTPRLDPVRRPVAPSPIRRLFVRVKPLAVVDRTGLLLVDTTEAIAGMEIDPELVRASVVKTLAAAKSVGSPSGPKKGTGVSVPLTLASLFSPEGNPGKTCVTAMTTQVLFAATEEIQRHRPAHLPSGRSTRPTVTFCLGAEGEEGLWKGPGKATLRLAVEIWATDSGSGSWRRSPESAGGNWGKWEGRAEVDVALSPTSDESDRLRVCDVVGAEGHPGKLRLGFTLGLQDPPVRPEGHGSGGSMGFGRVGAWVADFLGMSDEDGDDDEEEVVVSRSAGPDRRLSAQYRTLLRRKLRIEEVAIPTSAFLDGPFASCD
ncbi:hypothetical protein HDU96_006413 [Phlyctochytrium bullatum]|nr:hypothetical protein HDU96_006413 [Phlyctochytrium bullatum]